VTGMFMIVPLLSHWDDCPYVLVFVLRRRPCLHLLKLTRDHNCVYVADHSGCRPIYRIQTQVLDLDLAFEVLDLASEVLVLKTGFVYISVCY